LVVFYPSFYVVLKNWNRKCFWACVVYILWNGLYFTGGHGEDVSAPVLSWLSPDHGQSWFTVSQFRGCVCCCVLMLMLVLLAPPLLGRTLMNSGWSGSVPTPHPWGVSAVGFPLTLSPSQDICSPKAEQIKHVC